MKYKHHSIWLLITFVVGGLGYQLGKNQLKNSDFQNQISKSSAIIHKSEDKNTAPLPWIDIPIQDSKIHTSKEVLKKTLASSKLVLSDSGLLTTNDELLTKETIKPINKLIIDQASVEKIDFYLHQYFSEDSLINIEDKRSFAKRLLDEYSATEITDERTPYGSIYFSLTRDFPYEPVTNFTIKSNQKVFAHIQTNDSLSNEESIFVRWLRQSDNKVLLFQNQIIKNNTNQNWVSMRPHKGWKVGAYTVTFYTFNDELNVIAQSTYFVDGLLEE